MQVVLELPGGLCDGAGPPVHQVELRRMTGEDEAWLASVNATTPAAHVVTTLLARCTVRLGNLAEPGEEGLRRLLVGDRDYLLLGLRRLTFGSHFDGLLACPTCGETMDVSFEADQVPIQRRAQTQSVYEVELRRRDGSPVRVGFHLPTGADQEALAGDSTGDPGRRLLARCLESIDGRPINGDDIDSLDAASLDRLDEAMESLSPIIELSMRIGCPNCGHQFDADYDLVPFLLEEMRLSAGQLTREVHNLAYYYHWSLRDILGLTNQQRRQYVGLIGDEKLRGMEG
jgi:uncharacterized protein (UPF0212 family)